ncbi:hypothetical protein ACFL1X_13380 [Candidatus Hydrogenedentota bacterium]
MGAIQSLQVDQIGHGTRALEAPALVAHLVEKQIPVEMCPMSNVRTGVVDNLEDHPIRKYFDQGMIVNVNTDDPKMFGASLAEEYPLLEQKCSSSKQDVCRSILFGIESSWLPADRQESLIQSLENDPSWISN